MHMLNIYVEVSAFTTDPEMVRVPCHIHNVGTLTIKHICTHTTLVLGEGTLEMQV